MQLIYKASLDLKFLKQLSTSLSWTNTYTPLASKEL